MIVLPLIYFCLIICQNRSPSIFSPSVAENHATLKRKVCTHGNWWCWEIETPSSLELYETNSVPEECFSKNTSPAISSGQNIHWSFSGVTTNWNRSGFHGRDGYDRNYQVQGGETWSKLLRPLELPFTHLGWGVIWPAALKRLFSSTIWNCKSNLAGREYLPNFLF